MVVAEDARARKFLQTALPRALGVESGPTFSDVFRLRGKVRDLDAYDRFWRALERWADETGLKVSRDYLAFPAALTEPDDPRFDDQHGLDLIEASAAWNATTGERGEIIAVIDSGVDRAHPDLRDRLFVHPWEVAGNGIDDDGNGLVDDVSGWFFDEDGGRADVSDPNGHGTHVAGIAAASGNNGLGISGVNWGARLLPLKAGNDVLPWSAIIQAIDYTIDLKEKGLPVAVLNCSFDGAAPDETLLYAAFERAGEAGILACAAAGNNGTDNDDSFTDRHFYPADFDLDNILAVAAVTASDSLWSSSNYGETSVDLAAPGVSILSTAPGEQWNRRSGTSMSTAFVSGAAALLLSWNSGLNPAQLKSLLMDYGDTSVDLLGKTVSGNRLDLASSMSAAQDFPRGAWSAGSLTRYHESTTDLLLQADVQGGADPVVEVVFMNGEETLATDTNGADGWCYTWSPEVGAQSLHLQTTDVAGRVIRSRITPVEVVRPFDFWRFENWGVNFSQQSQTSATADPDSDGLVNLLEFARGGDPGVASDPVGQNGRAQLVFFEESGQSYVGIEQRMVTRDPGLFADLERYNYNLQVWEVPGSILTRSFADPEVSGARRLIQAIPVPEAASRLMLRSRVDLDDGTSF